MSEGEKAAQPAGELRRSIEAHIASKMTRLPCEACGNEDWTLSLSDEGKDDYASLWVALQTERWPLKLPIAYVTCTNCYHLRLFSIAPLLKQIREERARPKEEN